MTSYLKRAGSHDNTCNRSCRCNWETIFIIFTQNQDLGVSISESASMSQHLRVSISKSADQSKHLCVSIYETASLRQHVWVSIYESASLSQQIRVSISQSASHSQHLWVGMSESASQSQHLWMKAMMLLLVCGRTGNFLMSNFKVNLLFAIQPLSYNYPSTILPLSHHCVHQS